ncbi:MAG: DUF6904 family protein [bacterium]|jgi:hypothetical protein
MIYVQNTPNNAGVYVYGDYKDFDALYESLHDIMWDKNENIIYDSAMNRVMAVCYDLRHAIMGDREIEFVDNGMDADKMKWLAKVCSDKNVYYRIEILLPELLFVMVSINDFVKLYASKKSKMRYDMMLYKENIWDSAIAHTRIFQAEVAKCISSLFSKPVFSRINNLLNKNYSTIENYITQYIDVLNINFLNLDKEKRIKSIPGIAKKITEFNREYQRLSYDIKEAAKKYDCPTSDIKLNNLEDYPEEIDW